MVAAWNETTLPTLLSKYDLKDVFNADEFSLFYQCLPNKTYFKVQKCSGRKNSKVRLTGILAGMAAANAIREKLPMFVIGKSKIPRCFQHIKVNTNHKRKVGWTVKYLKNWCANLTKHFELKEERFHYLLITVLRIHLFPI